MPAALWPRSGDRQTTANNRVIAGARAYFFEAGTTTPLTVYADAALTVAHEHPVAADAYGAWPAVYLGPGLYRVRILDDEGAQISDFDGIVAPGVPGEGALEASAFVTASVLPAPDAATLLNTLGFAGYAVASIIGLASAAAARTLFDVEQKGIAAVAEKTDSATLALSDAGKAIHMNKATANTLTIPANAAVAFATGTFINVVQTGAGLTTIAGATGVTLNGVSAGSAGIAAQWGGVTLHKTAENVWVMVGLHDGVS